MMIPFNDKTVLIELNVSSAIPPATAYFVCSTWVRSAAIFDIQKLAMTKSGVNSSIINDICLKNKVLAPHNPYTNCIRSRQ